MGLFDYLLGSSNNPQPAPPVAPGGLLGDLSRVTSTAPVQSYQQYADSHRLANTLGGFNRSLLSGIIGMATDDTPTQYAAYLANLQKLKAGDTANRLNDINLNYYEGANLPQKNPAAGLLTPPDAAPAGLLGGPSSAAPSVPGAPPVPGVARGNPSIAPVPPIAGAFNAGVSLPAYSAQPPAVAAPAPTAPGGSGFMLDPATMIAAASRAMRVPALAPQATQYLKMAESALTNGLGVQNNGTVAPLPGMEPSKARLAYANSLGETVAGNNKSFDVAPGAMHFQGPTSLSGSPGGFSGPMVNPNSPALVNLDNRQPSEESKVVGKFFGDAYTGLQTATLQNPGKRANLDRLQALLENVNTGKFAGTTLEIKKTAKAAGIDLESIGVRDDVAPAEAARALSSAMALELRNPAGGAGMPGAMSDQDRAFLSSMVPGLDTTAPGRKLMVEYQKRLLDRSDKVAQMARDYRKKNGHIDEGFFDDLAQFSAANPIFTDADAKAIQGARGAAPPAAAAPANGAAGGPRILRFDAQGNPVQ